MPQTSAKTKPTRIADAAVVAEIEAEVEDEEDEAVIKATTKISGIGKTAPPRIGTAASPCGAKATNPIAKATIQ